MFLIFFLITPVSWFSIVIAVVVVGFGKGDSFGDVFGCIPLGIVGDDGNP